MRRSLAEVVMPRKEYAGWTEVEARAQVAAFERSGKSVADYAREHGVSARRLSYWRARLAEPRAAGLQLVELAVRSQPAASIEVGFPTGHVVRVAGSSLTDVLLAVAALAC